MKNKTTSFMRSKYLWIITLLFLVNYNSFSQFLLKQNNASKEISIHSAAKYIDVGKKELTLEEVQKGTYKFLPMPKQNTDFGFTASNFWIKFELKNDSTDDINYFFETARPITDVAELYVIDKNNAVSKHISGDAIPFDERSVDLRKTIFKIHLEPKESKSYFLHIKSDGEQLSMPLVLHNAESLLEQSSFEQFVFGFFYGILIIAAILYLFFFFGMKDKTFFYYSMYVVFIGLLQFSVDGYFYKFITPQSGWFSLHSVIIFATIASFFLGRYAQVFLKIKNYSKSINNAFYVLYALDALLMIGLFVYPKTLEYSYPIANLLGLYLLTLIISSIVIIYNKTKTIDKFFAVGILFLISGFVVFILKNFSVLPHTFWTENGSKLGTGMEVIFLSLSMANLIRNLKNEREALQELALQRAEEMNELKSYFLSNISHELRTPLNAIMSLTDVIANETDASKVKSNCDIIKYSSQSLLSSVNDILDFSKIEKEELKLELAPFEPVKILEQIKNNAIETAKNKGINIKYTIENENPLNVNGDGTRFAQIANNIINNAIKFTPEGDVKIHLDWKKTSGNQIKLVLKVTDTGVGIPKEKMNSIFDSFSQESINNKRKFGGLGLGLFIVKNLADLHNGSVDIKSQQGLGTICTVELQYDLIASENKSVTIIPNEDYDLKGKRILVVEDNAMNQMVIKMITKKWLNTVVEFANNGEEGVDQLKNNPFDIVLMDLQMPVMDGYEATIAIRKGEAGENNKDIPIIAVTADVMETTKERVFEIGMNKYLSKPVNKDTLYQNIKALV
ncbi:hybrid sensor histidine kinase/response regulator [Flavobacterium capsici]|uniref:histidine kinase n=1 Tax=Flavobacterium capsici TaxID=3075618 RepID=A0AA96F2G2_9FLAO|nr:MULTISPECIES: 7TM diverse intracellular signaling domain-containing protein [unclassified Flavobacterium]WNM18348.1 7TM diverse intracellular signaling domain-containing protein [Flavobacterium sp. PMR2A8]WNM22399.1 7TM diverse intracellular signaling domain-containing protein [Flavobacterium sp. PMTSA4]